VPYGLKWLADKKEFAEDEETFPWLRQIFELAARGWSPGRIALEMQLQDAPPPREKWTGDSVRYMLRNPIYAGMLAWDGEIHQSRYQCFIDKDLFARVQAILAKNGKIAPRTLGSQHILTPLLVCGNCGSRMDIKYNGSPGWKRRRYHCSNKYALLPEERCPTPYYDADSLETAVVEQLREIACRDDFFDAILEQAAAGEYSLEAVKKEIASLEAQLSSLARAENELFDDCYVKKIIPQDQFKRQNERLLEKKQVLENKLADARHLLQQDRRQAVENYKQELTRFTGIWDSLEPEEKRELIGSLVDAITIMPEKAIIKLLFGEVEIPTYEARRVIFFGQKEKDAANNGV
jgi:site-specific DNA recombinase